MNKPPKYCQGFEDRHGKPRWYYRRPGIRIPLPGLPWSPEFMAAYEKAVKGEKPEIGQSLTIAGSISALAVSFYNTSDFKGLSDSTKATYRGIIERFRAEHGHRMVREMQREHVQKIVARKSDTPAAANNMLRMIHLLMRHAVESGMRRDDPTSGVRKVRNKTSGFTTWGDEHIDSFLDYHKPGSRAYLAVMLLLYTGQRRSDVVRMGWKHVHNGYLWIKQQKTGQEVHMPLYEDLEAVLQDLPRDNPTFLVTMQGKPFTPAGFTNWFRDMVREAGLPDGLSAHGVRKSTCRRIAEAGGTPHEIMAVSGHKSLAEVTRYTVAAGRKELAARAMLALGKKEG